jgi:holo-[acyl-carrier protein] synthase
MILGVGVDVCEVARFMRLWQAGPERLLDRVCIGEERAYCAAHARPHEAIAGRWCAKEAVAKALGTGFAHGVTPRTIEVQRAPDGSLRVALHGPAAQAAARRRIAAVHLSISHNEQTAAAFAVAEG